MSCSGITLTISNNYCDISVAIRDERGVIGLTYGRVQQHNVDYCSFT